ncbi:receptor-type tyrosine-protein phosphatase N2 isoform X5 [Odocoileus virginianus]|uniref:Receptor-type tyrosine-protein phosphatase N2 isoform X5 n=1 Tax=Odocoileus virginianus TaxID=9874 RepID=A0ABM4J4F3_ODOVR
MGPPLALLLLLLLPRAPPAAPAPAPRARPLPGLLGCLFEDGLCRPAETCVNDGVFGRCQEFPAMDVLRYEVSPGVLQHLTATLQKLSRTGLTWQDDYTQRVMARELASLPQTYPRHPEASSPARSSKQSVPDERSLSLEGGVLAEALQRYLPYLEALSQAAAADALPGPEPDRPPAQGEDPLADSVLTFVAQKSALTYAPAARPDFAGVRPLRTLHRFQPDELSPKVASGVDRQRLVAALGAYAARKAAAPARDGDPEPRGLVRAPWRAARVLSAPAAPQRWPSPADPRDAQVTDNEAHVQTLLKDLRKRPAGVEGLSALDVDEVARALASAVPSGGAAGRGGGLGAEAVGAEAALHGDRGPESRVRGRDGGLHQEVNHLGVQLGDLLQGPGSPFLPGAPRHTESFKTESKKGDDPEASLSSEEERAGVENVRSQTYSKELLQRPPHARPGLGGPGATPLWAPAAPQGDLHLGASARGPPGPGLRLQVRPQEEEYGYIVMENDSLSLDKGTQALEDVARLLEVPAGVFTDVEVEGPAVTFRVRANAQNVTAAAAAKAAADNKDKLQTMSGLRVLQAGVGTELCRQRMAVRTTERPEATHTSRVSSVSSQFSDGPMPSPSARSSTSSWSEEPVQPNMDISTGHMVLAYMEDHLKNKNRLEKEWEALCAYQAEPNSSLVAQREENLPKNRCPAVLTYDHSRIRLKSENSHSSSDYINASPIMDHDPRKPAYIATQGPLPSTVADFWQMVWESGCVVIVMLTPLSENGVRQCYHYWPDEGSNLYHIYEVHLVSEHIWCEDFLVRSFYLKNLQTNETRTVTQFHFLSWYDQGVPSSTRSLLDFRRKVNKCYRGRSCPIIVHCSDGAGRSGTYVLIDMVLNKMAKGAKEIDIAATLEHLRDQRPGMVQTKEQFEFALTAVAEEVNAILKAFPQ